MSGVMLTAVRPGAERDAERIREMLRDEGWTDPTEQTVMNAIRHDIVRVTTDGNDYVLSVLIAYKLGEDKFDVALFMTDKKYRGLGLGKKCWKAAVGGIGPHCNISLSAAEGTIPMYNKKGFGVIGPQRKTYVGVPNRAVLSDGSPEGVVVEPLGKDHLDDLRDYDIGVSGLDRFATVRQYLATCSGAVLVARKDNQVLGFSSLDKREQYHAFAPLYADNKGVAMALMSHLLQNVPVGDPILLEVFDENQPASELRKALGINQVLIGDQTLMFTRESYGYQIDKVYSTIASCFPLL